MGRAVSMHSFNRNVGITIEHVHWFSYSYNYFNKSDKINWHWLGHFIFYKKHMINGSDNFITVFAVIDIIGATLILPQICFDLLVDHSGYNRFI